MQIKTNPLIRQVVEIQILELHLLWIFLTQNYIFHGTEGVDSKQLVKHNLTCHYKWVPNSIFWVSELIIMACHSSSFLLPNYLCRMSF